MATFIIKGGKRLRGSIETTAGKNAPVALLCASLLIKDTVVLANMTRVEEVERILEILKSIGVRYRWLGARTLWLDTSDPIHLGAIDREACEATRASLLLLGSLAKRVRAYKLYKSGGCKLGNRTIRPHLFALQKLGVEINFRSDHYEVTNRPLRGQKVVMYESGDTATENAIMVAVLAKGKTVITFASANYMVLDLCYFLTAAGAKINGIGTTTLTITGVTRLHCVKRYAISPDPVDAMAWLSLAITTKSCLTVKHCPLQFLELELEKLSVMGQKYTIENRCLAKNGKIETADIKIIPSTLVSLPDKLYGRPFPGLNIDNVPLFVPLLTQAKGETLVHDWCYENRAVYYLELQKLGANILLLDPHRALVKGPTALKSNSLQCPLALRPAMAILIAMIAAKGRSYLHNTYVLERGYDDLLTRLQSIGVNIISEL